MNWRILFISLIPLWLHAQTAGDEHWDVRFGPSGTENTALTVLRHGGDVYVGGIFTMAGDVNATNIARWDGTNWHSLGGGLGSTADNSFVFALAADGSNIYAGGFFTNSGGSSITSSVVRWDGSRWSEVGSVRGAVAHLQAHEGALYATGGLRLPGDTNTYGVALFDGQNWNPFGSVISGCVGQFCTPGVINLLVEGSTIYAVGQFTSIGGTSANAVARWHGLAWAPMGAGFTGTNVIVSGVLRHNGQLYASGTFQSAGGTAAQNLALWTGAEWQPFSGANRDVRRILSDGSSLYAVGDFTTIGGATVNRAARWNGSSWTALGTGVGSGILDGILNGTELLVSGQFANAGSTFASGVARWDGAQWSALNAGNQNGANIPLGVVRALDVFNGSLYAGGDFTGLAGAPHSRVARWNGKTWSPLGSGIIGPSGHRVRAITHSSQNIYVGGTFTNIGGITASNVARWNGLAWEPFGGGVNSNVHALVWDSGYLFAGGAFTAAGGSPANRIAYATTTGTGIWFPKSFGSGVNSNVNALLMLNGHLIVGGLFTVADGITSHKLADFSDFNPGWRAIGGNAIPPGGNVLALAASGTNLYVAGSFVIPGINATNIARWDGTSWSALGRGLLGRTVGSVVNALAVRGHELYAAGTLTNASGLPAQAIAKWDGTNWHALGSGLQMIPSSPAVSALAVYDDALYVGGLFVRAGGRPSICIARWIPDIQLQITDFTYAPGEFRLQAQPARGLKLRLDATSDLNTWIPVLRQNSYSDSADLVDQMPAPNRRFYRVVAEP